MATHRSAVKAHRQNLKRREQNRELRTRLRSALKSIRAAVDSKDQTTATTELRETVSLIDRMASKGVIHRNAAGRYKSRLTTGIKQLSGTK